jgi:hypothetical protein
MPNVSRETASEKIAFEGLDVRFEQLDGGYSVCIVEFSPRGVLGETIPVVIENRQSAGVAVGGQS